MRSDPGQLYPVSLRLLSSADFRKVIAGSLSAGFREHMSFAKTQKRPPWQAQRGPSVARYALLQIYAPFASHPAAASRFRKVAAGTSRAGFREPASSAKTPAISIAEGSEFFYS